MDSGSQCGKQIPSQLYIQNIVCLKAKMLEDHLDSSNIFDAFSFIKYKVRKEIDE